MSLVLNAEAAGPCRGETGGRFVLDVRPEAPGINPSPWYAFALESAKGGPATVTLKYAGARHRYPPWIRHSEGDWQRLPDDDLDLSDAGREAVLTLDLLPGRTDIAAWPVFSVDRHRALAKRLQAKSGIARVRAGRSGEGRAIEALVRRAGPQAPWLILLGHQHPPEMAGAFAMEAFLERLFAGEGAREPTANILAISLINPDGLARGHWRGDAQGRDLNRMWDESGAPEVEAVRRFIERETGGPGAGDLLIDFHATRGAKLYVPPRRAMSADQARFLKRWYAGGGLPPRRAAQAPGEGTAKTALGARWGVLAVTFEADDRAGPGEAQAAGRAAAAALVDALSERARE